MVERFNRRIQEAIAREPKRGVDHRTFASKRQPRYFQPTCCTSNVNPPPRLRGDDNKNGQEFLMDTRLRV